jgi:dihydropteroate synthase
MAEIAVMGILNATPDSFANGGVPATIAAGLRMIEDGAAILDVGGESTRPGATVISPAEERARVLLLIEALAPHGVPISIDTRNAATMRAALAAGATIVNDVTGLAHDPEAASIVAAAGCRVVLMHMRGTPLTMTSLTQYDDVVTGVLHELSARVEVALNAGIAHANIIIDPGIGFAKTAAQNLELLQRLPEFAVLGLPILVGVSRKTFIGTYGDAPDPQRRVPGSIAAALFAADRGASILRVHDVAETRQALRVWTALRESRKGGEPGALPLDPAGA